MGNYMETCIQKKQKEEEEEEKPQKHQESEDQESGKKQKGSFGIENGRMRVKLVLTKDELEWLLLQLKNNKGKKLEDVLEEIEKGRMAGKSVIAGWKPSLESIMETPEVHHEMNKSS